MKVRVRVRVRVRVVSKCYKTKKDKGPEGKAKTRNKEHGTKECA